MSKLTSYLNKDNVINIIRKFQKKYPYSLSSKEEIEEIEKMPLFYVEINGNTSDGYHTFNELYHHKAILFSVICNTHPEIAWKSKKHEDGTMYEGMFIVGINTPKGQATYHFNIDPYWEIFKVSEYGRAPKWDGHTSNETIERITSLNSLPYMLHFQNKERSK